MSFQELASTCIAYSLFNENEEAIKLNANTLMDDNGLYCEDRNWSLGYYYAIVAESIGAAVQITAPIELEDGYAYHIYADKINGWYHTFVAAKSGESYIILESYNRGPHYNQRFIATAYTKEEFEEILVACINNYDAVYVEAGIILPIEEIDSNVKSRYRELHQKLNHVSDKVLQEYQFIEDCCDTAFEYKQYC